MSYTNNNSVLYNVDQSFPETSSGGASKERARNNIGAASASALTSEIARATSAELAAKTEVVGGDGVTVTSTTGLNGQSIYTVSGNGQGIFKRVQNPIEQSYADYGFIKKLNQTANGEVSIECSYISAATSSVTGLMSSSDKSKLDGIASGAQVNQNAWSNLHVGSTTISADSATDTLTLVAGSNVTLTPDATNDSLTISATDTQYTAGPNIDILSGIISTEKTVVAAGSNISVTSSLDSQTRTLTYTVSGSGSPQVNADWDANSGVSQILNKPTLQYKPYGGSAGKLTSLLVDADDPEGYVSVSVNGGGAGGLVAGPYAGLLNSGVNGVGDSDTPIYINSSGEFATCTNLPNVEYIQFNYSNETTAQDSVYTSVAAAYTAGRLPVLYCGVANATLYWFPTADGANGYSFSRTVSNYSYVVTIDASTHVISHQSKEIINYTAGSNISISANNEISATDTTYTAGYGIDINASNVISNTMHLDTAGLMISYNTLSNAGITTHSFGPWRIQLTKRAMATWDDGTGSNPSIYVQVAHSDYISGTITNGRIQHVNYYPWKDGTMDSVYTGHVQWAFTGSYTQGGSNNGFPIDLTSPMDSDGYARACPKGMRALHLIYNCGIDSPDWLELNIEPLYVNNNTTINTNAARLLIRAKYFYV